MIYPGSTPEFRVLIKVDGTQVIQLRYINITQGYTGRWQDLPVVKEYDDTNQPSPLVHL
jgi:hypothetical protein